MIFSHHQIGAVLGQFMRVRKLQRQQTCGPLYRDYYTWLWPFPRPRRSRPLRKSLEFQANVHWDRYFRQPRTLSWSDTSQVIREHRKSAVVTSFNYTSLVVNYTTFLLCWHMSVFCTFRWLFFLHLLFCFTTGFLCTRHNVVNTKQKHCCLNNQQNAFTVQTIALNKCLVSVGPFVHPSVRMNVPSVRQSVSPRFSPQ